MGLYARHVGEIRDSQAVVAQACRPARSDSIYHRFLRPDQDYGTFFLAASSFRGQRQAALEDRWLLSLITVVRNAKESRGARRNRARRVTLSDA